jgi:hypothetical protein
MPSCKHVCYSSSAEMLEETNVDDLSDAAIIQGMWAAAEDAAGDDDEAEDGDALLEQLDPAEVGFRGLNGSNAAV